MYIFLLLSIPQHFCNFFFFFYDFLVFRALGIPCRVITNYISAHDSNSNLVIERHINENGETINSMSEMIW